ncbi:MAG: phosphoribosylglycinamide formyltransferase [Verrucomicrobiae bacterium]|nr:phosphoribosylglycinamide formyltransferase [Verrucomicrobiae bacterium]
MSAPAKLRIGILGSGRGSNAQCILEACQRGAIPAEVAIVLSDVENAKILDRARQFGVAAKFIPPGKFKTRLEPDVEREYVKALRDARVDVVALAGFMRILKGDFLNAFPNRVMNIHPALLPAFPGLESWKQAIDYGAKVAGCTVHFVNEGMDTGPIILQAAVPVLENDTTETLHARIQEQEHRLYPRAIRLFAGGKLKIDGRRVRILA